MAPYSSGGRRVRLSGAAVEEALVRLAATAGVVETMLGHRPAIQSLLDQSNQS
jgi:hypothetical protein